MKTDFTLKPIPKYIVTKIRKLDFERCPDQKGQTRFYSYLTRVKGELMKITVAAKTLYKKWHCKQVAAHGVRSERCFVKDMAYTYLGGYSVGWGAEGSKRNNYWEDGKWYDCEFKYYNPSCAPLVNLEYVGKFPQFKYSAYHLFRDDCIIEYLRIYSKYPQAEYLLKLGLTGLYKKLTILKLIGRDKQFCKWLIAHQNEIAFSFCYAGVLIKAYKTGKPIKQIQKIEQFKKTMKNNYDVPMLQDLFGESLEKFYTYIAEQNTEPSSYIDYLKACKYLRLSMSRRKNLTPSNFKYWHDRRINEYNTMKARADKKQREELYKQFAIVSNKYLALQSGKGGYTALIAKSPAELIYEGEQLKHCVGKMNYEQKMVSEETLIFFIRSIEQPSVPFVTVEYSLKSKKVLQCYGYDSKKPDENVITFVNKVWLPYANRTIKKLYA